MAVTKENATQLVESFAKHYYSLMQTNRPGLGVLFDLTVSQMSFEGGEFQGRDAILKKLIELPFQKVEHIISTVDAHPTIDGGCLGVVMGQLKTDSDQPHSFSQTFYIKPDASGSFCLLNTIFRLVLHNF